MILRPARTRRIRDLDALQAIIHRTLPALQLQPRIRAVGEQQRVARELLHGLCVEVFGGSEIAVLESLVALLFESVGGGGHLSERGEKLLFAARWLLRWRACFVERDDAAGSVRIVCWYYQSMLSVFGAEVGRKVEWVCKRSRAFGECGITRRRWFLG